VNLTAVVVDYPFLLSVYRLPMVLQNGQTDADMFVLKVPSDMAEGEYRIRIDFFENGKPIGHGYVILKVLPAAVKPRIKIECRLPDLSWTILILLLGLIISLVVFMRLHDAEEEKYLRSKGAEYLKAPARMEELRQTKDWKGFVQRVYNKPGLFAFLIGALFFVIWLIVVWLLLRCA
jgi:hypothetical protein